MGLTLTEVETMPYRKLLALVSANKAVHAEEMLDLLHVVANPNLLQSKKGQKEYPKLFKVFEKIIKEFGTKTITVDANMDQIIAMKKLQMEARRERKNGRIPR